MEIYSALPTMQVNFCLCLDVTTLFDFSVEGVSKRFSFMIDNVMEEAKCVQW